MPQTQTARVPWPDSGDKSFSSGTASLLLLAVALFTSPACCKATPFSRGEPIPLGPYSVTVNYVETEQGDDGNTLLSVHFRLVQVKTVERRLLPDTGPKPPRFTVVDRDGREYRFKSMKAGSDSEDWVIRFSVPPERGGFSAVINNPAPRGGQPCVATVPLGR